MKIIKLWYSIHNHGDGSAYPHWFGSEATARQDQQNLLEPWGEDCIGAIQSFEDSDEHRKAIDNDNRQAKKQKLRAGMTILVENQTATITEVNSDGVFWETEDLESGWIDFSDIVLK